MRCKTVYAVYETIQSGELTPGYEPAVVYFLEDSGCTTGYGCMEIKSGLMIYPPATSTTTLNCWKGNMKNEALALDLTPYKDYVKRISRKMKKNEYNEKINAREIFWINIAEFGNEKAKKLAKRLLPACFTSGKKKIYKKYGVDVNYGWLDTVDPAKTDLRKNTRPLPGELFEHELLPLENCLNGEVIGNIYDNSGLLNESEEVKQ